MTISETDRKHRNLLHVTLEFNDKVRPRLKVDKEKKRYAQEKQRLPIAPENVLNEICQIIYSLYQALKIAKQVYNNIINSIKS